MSGLFAVLLVLVVCGVAAMSGFVSVGFVAVRGSVMLLMELLGAIGAFEFMALARNGKHGNGHKKDGERFHRAASIATRRRNATPKEVEIHARSSHAATARAARS